MNSFVKFLGFISVMALIPACAGVQKNTTPATPMVTASAAVEPKPTSLKIEKPKTSELLQCVQGEDKRTVAVEPLAKGCDVRYSKFGNSEVVANAVHTPSFCKDVEAKIRTHLEAGQFSCR
jgi:hypothetical protein